MIFHTTADAITAQIDTVKRRTDGLFSTSRRMQTRGAFCHKKTSLKVMEEGLIRSGCATRKISQFYRKIHRD